MVCSWMHTHSLGEHLAGWALMICVLLPAVHSAALRFVPTGLGVQWRPPDRLLLELAFPGSQPTSVPRKKDKAGVRVYPSLEREALGAGSF